jgi:hypothetical protein
MGDVASRDEAVIGKAVIGNPPIRQSAIPNPQSAI